MKITFLMAIEDRIWNMKKAVELVSASYPGLAQAEYYSVWDLAVHTEKIPQMEASARGSDFVFVYFHGGAQSLPDFHLIWKEFAGRPIYFESSIPEELAELMPTSGLTPAQYKVMSSYFALGTPDNYASMIKYIAREFFGADCEVPAPKPPAEDGFFEGGLVLSDEESEALKKQAAASKKPVIAIIIHHSQVMNGNTRHIEALIKLLREKGAVVLPMFTRMASDEDGRFGVTAAMDRWFTYEGKKLPDLFLVLTGFSLTRMSSPGDGSEIFDRSIFEGWNVPAMQVMTTRYSRHDYEELPYGLDSMGLSMYIFQPELDGQIITVPLGAQEEISEDGASRKVFIPIEDRAKRIADLAVNWAVLSRKEPEEKKIAILFHCMPGNCKIGVAEGLDTFESVRRIALQLKEKGIKTDFDMQSSQELADRLTSGLTNDLSWLSEDAMLEKAAAKVGPEYWTKWFDGLTPKMLSELSKRWGSRPGEPMVVGDSFVIPGLIFGNIFIGMQPARATGEKAAELYHSTDSTPPYSYIATYRWISEIFGADAVCHIGTHGSLEWLPGKEVGLSSSCYPDASLASIPNFYPYHIGIVGEGIQAKRRSWATLLDHIPPSLDEAGAYESLAVIDEALKEYSQAKQMRPAQVPSLAARVFELAEKANMTEDLGLTREDFEKDSEAVIDRIHIWMGDIKFSAVKDGLHIFGEVPSGKLYNNMLRMLVRVRNGNVPSLSDSILAAMGYDADRVKQDPAAMFGLSSGLMLMDEATEASRRIMQRISDADFDTASIEPAVAAESFPGPKEDLKTVLHFVCTEVKDRLDRCTDEMTNLIAGLEGGFVPPSAGGNPTRGNVSILPSGRNFYAVDPAQIPSRAAFQMGKVLAEQMIARFKEDSEGFPESVAMVVWAGNTVKTVGEDFAECLYLMGVRPVYLGVSTTVLGVEPIPYEELGRPRIDVNLRISGLFRDMFPNLIKLMDQAVAKTAALDEPEDINYIKKHVREDMEKLISEGVPEEQARDEAYPRVFGCAPGCYGTGVAKLIDSKQWNDFHDIAKVFETWSSYVYSSKEHGVRHTESFRQKMSKVSVTIKNESQAEYDMLDSDDFYGYHGGLAAYVRDASGNKPLSITGHTDDPDRPVTRDINRETARIVRSRLLNPKWIEGLQRHGFKGAQEIALAVDHFFGWDATAGTAKDWMYQAMAERYMFDEELREWMQSVNKWSVLSVSERLLEASRRGMWNADPDTIKKLETIYMNAEGSIEEALS